MIRPTLFMLLALLLPLPAGAEVAAVRAGDAVILSNSVIRVRLDLRRGGCPTEIGPGAAGESLCGPAFMSLYYDAEKRWLTELDIPGATAEIRRPDKAEGGGVTVAVTLPTFPGWEVRKVYRLGDDSPVLSVAYHVRAKEALRPYPFIPVNLAGRADADTLLGVGGAVSRDDLKVDDFALVMNESPWYGFARGVHGPGIAAVLVKWPEWFRRHTIGRRKDGTLFLHARLFPEPFKPGQEVEFAYNLVAFNADGARAVKAAQAAPAAAVAAAGAPAQAPRGVRTLCVPRITRAPDMDGSLDDPCWKLAAVADGWMRYDGSGFPEAETVGRVVYDAQALYVGIRCAEPLMENLVTHSRERGPNVWQDDCVEVRLDPRRDRKTSLQLVVNALGVQQDNLLGEGGLTRTRWSAAAHRGSNFWSVEIRIPWADLDMAPPRPGDAWGFNLNRERRPKRETTGWCPTPAGFHQADRYGDLLFGRGDVEVVRVDPGLEAGGKGARILLRSRRAAPVAVSGSAAVAREGKTPVLASGTATLPANGEVTLAIPYEARETGSYRVALTVVAGGEVIYAAPFTGTLRGAGLNSTLWPAEEQEHTLYVARETMQHFFFLAANHSQRKYDTFDFVLLLPEGIQFTDCVAKDAKTYHRARKITAEEITRDGKPYRRVVITSESALAPGRIEKLRFYQAYLGALAATPAIADGKHRLYYYLQAPGDREEEHGLDLVVLPAPAGKQPREIPIGMSLWTITATEPFWQGLLETYRRSGINSVESGRFSAEPRAAREAREYGMRPWMLLWWSWWNEEYLQTHPEAAAVKADGKPDPKMVCPEVLADPAGDAIVGPMQRFVEAAKEGACEVVWWDLEGPGAFSACFCSRCLERFRRENGIAEGEKLSPLLLQTRYAEKWVAFACDQSARLCARIRQYARESGSKLRLGVYSGVQNAHTMRDYRVDWVKLAPHLDVATPSFYSFGVGGLAEQFTRGIPEAVKVVKGVHDIPVLATLTTGYEGTSLTRDARATKLQMLKAVAHGANGVYFWWWGTNDGRHYRATADASSVIADLETFFTKGGSDDALARIEPAEGASHACWRLGNQVAVLLFNHRDEAREVRITPGTLEDPAKWRIARASAGLEKAKWSAGGVSVTVPALDAAWLVLAR